MPQDHVRVGVAGPNDTKNGVKYDGGKSPLWSMVLSFFPRALAAVGDVSKFGASKYPPNSWRDVPDGITRFTNALIRHVAADHPDEYPAFDDESDLLHAAHAAWNALARLELMLSEEERFMEEFSVSSPIDAHEVPAGQICGILAESNRNFDASVYRPHLGPPGRIVQMNSISHWGLFSDED